ncbi:MAG: phage tail sheath subtilisin-like domain-containing protein [Trichodesmium sp. MAG_R03]|nr:phage tail sheath subtilisin-like domain-containing protein [Trichodesmium sp. MAG_R03]
MVNYKTPNVYIEEISKLPPSVAGVATGIPAFLGYTAKVIQNDGEDLTRVPTRITSIFEYEELFGNAEPAKFEIQETADGISISNMADVVEVKYLMYYALQMFFNNGGGPCYIVSVGTYSDSGADKEQSHFEKGLAALKKEDEPTLILLSDAANLPLGARSKPTDYYDLCQKALAQCNTLQDRFAVFDVVQVDPKIQTKDDVDNFRNGIGQEYLNYGAVYYPYLQTSLNYHYTGDSVTVEPFSHKFEHKTDTNALIVSYTGEISDTPAVAINDDYSYIKATSGNTPALTVEYKEAEKTVATLITAWGTTDPKGNFDIKQNAADGDIIDTSGNKYLAPGTLWFYEDSGLVVTHVGAEGDKPKVNIVTNDTDTLEITVTKNTLEIKLKSGSSTTVRDIIEQWRITYPKGNFDIAPNDDSTAGDTAIETPTDGEQELTSKTLRFYDQISGLIFTHIEGGDESQPEVTIAEGDLGITVTKKTLTIQKLTSTTVQEVIEAWNAKYDRKYFDIKPNAANITAITGANNTDELTPGFLSFYTDDAIAVTHIAANNSISPKINIKPVAIDFEIGATKELTIKLKETSPRAVKVINTWKEWKNKNNAENFELAPDGTGMKIVETTNSMSLTPIVMRAYRTAPNGLAITHKGGDGDTPSVTITEGDSRNRDIQPNANNITITITAGQVTTVQDILDEWGGVGDDDKHGFELKQDGDGSTAVKALEETYLISPPLPLWYYKTANTGLYNDIKSEISKKRVILPPSSSMAGVYARVDRDRGVWKAPANVSLASVTAPMVKITNKEQEDLNVDSTAGKSINAIRYFTGKGVLVWGARTLAGNDNEWRYVPVRRLFIYVEESVKKATEFAVFEPNVSTTWLKVKSMIESFLEGLWRQGALAGSTAQQAFFVNVGLGVTMTSQDILEGRMNVEIGLAAVRPAEFIILKFSHKLQEA